MDYLFEFFPLPLHLYYLDHSSKILWSKFEQLESSIVPNIVASRAKPLKLGGLDSSMHWIRAAWPTLVECLQLSVRLGPGQDVNCPQV